VKQPIERGDLIRRPKPKAGHCATCEPTPKDRVSADELWQRHRATLGFVVVPRASKP